MEQGHCIVVGVVIFGFHFPSVGSAAASCKGVQDKQEVKC